MKIIEGFTVSYQSKRHGWISPRFFNTYNEALNEKIRYEQAGYNVKILKDVSYQIVR